MGRTGFANRPPLPIVRPVIRGKFLTLEGGEGAGKSTQAALIVERLRARGLEVIATREPGGSDGAESLRALLVQGEVGRWSATSEALLMYAARCDHLERLIRPSLVRGAWVVCDRFSDSSRAYQGAGGNAPEPLLDALDAYVVGADRPDLTLLFDVPVEIGLERARARGGDARFESKGLAFHERLRARYLQIVADNPERCVRIDAAAASEQVAERAWRAVEQRLLSSANG